MKEIENAIYNTENFMCDNNPLKHKASYDQRRDHKAFDDVSTNIENGTVDSQGHEDRNAFSDATSISSYDNMEKVDQGSLATELTNESKDVHFAHNGFSNPFLNCCDHDYMDKKVLEYDVVKDICVDMGIHEEKTDVGDMCVRNGYKSTNPFLEPEECREDSSCEHTTKAIDSDDIITSDCEDRSSIVGNECERIDQVTPSHQMPDEQQVSEDPKESSRVEQATSEEENKKSDKDLDPRPVQVIIRDEESTTGNVLKEQSLVTEEDARNPKESSNDHSQVHCNDDETQEIRSKDANFYQAQVRNATSDQNKSQLQPDEGETSFSGASLVEYSGPMIAYSGSISHRSDASTSCRSFAFPILQSEWDSSPVRMSKADKRHYRKNKGWRSGLFCCRF